MAVRDGGNNPAAIAKSQWVAAPFGKILDIPTDLYNTIKQDMNMLLEVSMSQHKR